MWWGKKEETTSQKPDGTTNEASVTSSDQSSVSHVVHESKKKLPASLQKMVNDEDKKENAFDELVDGYAPESTESNVRYLGYANRVRTILLSAQRYVAYTSDIGESFRPVAHPKLVKAAYGISWAYILGDVSYEGYKAYWHNQRVKDPGLQLSERQQKLTGMHNVPPSETTQLQPGTVPPLQDYKTVMAQRAIFQSIASMGLPAFTIHSVVRYSGRAMKNMKNTTLRTWGPIGLGLSVVPALPSLFDEPVENAVEWAFHKGFEAFGGHEYVGNAPSTGREDLLAQKPKEKKL